MSTSDPGNMAGGPAAGASGQPSEEELRAAYEAELKRITTTDVILQTAVSLINLAGRRLGRVAGAEDERDLEQVRDAIDAVRGLVPVLERRAGGPEMAPLREALSQLQMAYASDAQGAGAGGPAEGGAAERSGVGGGEGSGVGGGEGSDGEDAGSGGGEEGSGSQERPAEQGPGPAQSSGRLWVPGQ